VVVSAVYGTRKGLETWQAQWSQQQRQGSDAAETPAETLQQVSDNPYQKIHTCWPPSKLSPFLLFVLSCSSALLFISGLVL
jgi:hypothetical protein